MLFTGASEPGQPTHEGGPLMAEPAALRRATADRIVCDLGSLTKPDLRSVDALARLALLAARLRFRLELRHASADIRELIALAGLSEVLPCVGDSGVEVGR
jgi:hypothetical protein